LIGTKFDMFIKNM